MDRSGVSAEDCFFTHSPEESILLGKKISKRLSKKSILCFFGTLGSGKTTLIKGIVQGITGLPPEEISSPTFVYHHLYQHLSTSVSHFDLYRLSSPKEFILRGFEEYLYAENICCIEWSERIASLLPPHCMHIHLSHEQESSCRKIILKKVATKR